MLFRSFVNYDGSYHGASHDTVKAFCRDADLFINLSGGSWFWRDEYAAIPRRVFIDSDPVFTQLAIAKAEGWYVNFFKQFTTLFTFGANIGTPACDVPTGDFTWLKTWQPVVLDEWRSSTPPGDCFTTVMTWRIESFADVDGNKDREFVKVIDLPTRTPHQFELAVNGPQTLLRQHGWATVDAMGVSRSLWDYRQFIQGSKAEFGVAKHTYVSHRSGWFSDRTECYLAVGRPAIVQDTGWSSHLPAGVGLVPFSTVEEAIAGLDRVADLYDLTGVHVVLDGQLAGGDDALGLVADVEEDLVAVDLDDGAGDDVAVVEVLDRRVDRGDQVLGRADVVEDRKSTRLNSSHT